MAEIKWEVTKADSCVKMAEFLPSVSSPFTKHAETTAQVQNLGDISEEYTVEPQWLEHLWDYGNSFETWVLRATEGDHGTSSGSK